MSSPNTIMMVAPAPPRTVVLPNEVLRMIFEYILVFSTVSPPGRPVNATRFPMLYRCIIHKLAVVSPQVHEVAFAMFYERNFFNFTTGSSFNPAKAPLMPPLRLRSHLRYVQISLHVTDYWVTFAQEDDRTVSTRHYFADAAELFGHCPAARTLKHLSASMPLLRVLDLQIVATFLNPDRAAALNVYRSAGFSVRARDDIKIKVEKSDHGFPKAWPSVLHGIILGIDLDVKLD